MWRTSPVRSASGPTIIPGVSTSETTGKPHASHSCRKRAALSPASAVIAPATWRVSLARNPTVRPSMRPSAVHSSGANPGRSTVTESASAMRLDDRLHVVRRALALGHRLAQGDLVGSLGAIQSASPPRK